MVAEVFIQPANGSIETTLLQLVIEAAPAPAVLVAPRSAGNRMAVSVPADSPRQPRGAGTKALRTPAPTIVELAEVGEQYATVSGRLIRDLEWFFILAAARAAAIQVRVVTRAAAVSGRR